MHAMSPGSGRRGYASFLPAKKHRWTAAARLSWEIITTRAAGTQLEHWIIGMANHKRKRAKNRQCGCLLCKPWKVNGYRTERLGGKRFSDHRRRKFAAEEIRAKLC